MDLPYSAEIIEHCNVSPPPNSAPTTSIPITFFDIPWLLAPPVERILFYEFPHPTLHFTQAILPQLKHSLSLALQHFFPLAGSLVCPPLPTKPHILYTSGDSIPLTIAESNSDFADLVKNFPRDAKEFRPLVPRLSQETSLSSSGTDQVTIQLLRPLIALQVTLFPNSGISICFTYCHMVGDGRTMNQFIKLWASIFKSNNDLSLLVQPFYDRAGVIKDTSGLLSTIWNHWCEFGASWDNVAIITTGVMPQDSLHATFIMNRLEINKLRHWIASQFHNVDEPPPLPYVSTFVITSAFTWVCLTKTKNIVAPPLTMDDEIVSSDDDVLNHFGFIADCTDHKEFYVPKTYIGNCLTLCCASVRRSELLGENGLFTAAKAIMRAIKELDSGLLRGAETWIPDIVKIFTSGHLVSAAGSPKLRVYETDFGWGRPRKSEVVHIDKSPGGTISLTESRDEEGGVEVGLALSKVGMEAFISIYERGLQNQWC